MIFNSSGFLLFLPLTFLVYWVIGSRQRNLQNILILLASYVFYGWWDWRFLSLIGISTLADFFISLNLSTSDSARKRKGLLWLSLLLNLGLLGFFKYYNFFVDSLQAALIQLGMNLHPWTLEIILPVGISFYTFQTLSYTLDIYHKKIIPTKDLISFAAFVAFFPQLVAGPIERAKHLLPQFERERYFDLAEAIRGISMILYGFVKKVVIADRLAIYVDSVFGAVEAQNSLSLSIGLIFFSLQIYCDFSGYSLIARGVAKLFGFEIMINFNKPYLASSITQFWRRWHISLSTWFRDYVYIPLGGNRISLPRTYVNIFLVFLLSGLWHGANWTFVIWGALHGVYQLIYLSYAKLVASPRKESWARTIGNTLLVYIAVCLAWVFFRVDSLPDAMLYLQKLGEGTLPTNLMQLSAEKGPFNLFLSVVGIGILLASYLLPDQLKFRKPIQHVLFASISIIIIITLGINGEPTFIYFQF
ncbi:MAG: MBOAT family O-acyltransferase [Bacteroidota bacterium]